MFLLFSVALADTCGQYGDAESLPSLTDTTVDEASGTVELRSRPGVWVTHNDAGGVPALYTFSLDGELLETIAVIGATHRDWEDIAAGPCPSSEGRCLFIGDIGDNARDNEEVIVYAVPEPVEGAASTTVEATWTARWPEGPADSEALLYHPCTDQLLLVTKTNDAPAVVWQLPAEPGEGTLEAVATLDLTALELGSQRITGADWDDAGERLILRTYSELMEWATDPDDPLAHWAAPPDTRIPSGGAQLEAVAYALNGDIVSISEGEDTHIFRWACEGLTEGGCPQADTGEPPDTAPPDSADTDTDTDTDAGDSAVPVADKEGCGGRSTRGAGIVGLLLLALSGRRR